MFCDTHQVNQLTALLIGHGIRDVVVCPGSRNATIVHNLHALPEHFSLHPVTDERSAAFVALGIILATQRPVAVCVTSGSALLACIPAVAEAYYRHLPLLVISADRPAPWCGQMDGQTLPQNGALQPYCPTSRVVEAHTDELKWANNRLMNEALISLQMNGGGPAHINVEIAEPMFSFTTRELPGERIVRMLRPDSNMALPEQLVADIAAARLPVLLIGQYEAGDIRREVADLSGHAQLLVLAEVISDVRGSFRMNAFDDLSQTDECLVPDLIVQVGGNFVHKKFKQLLRRSSCRVVRVGLEKLPPDTFCHLDTWLPVSPQCILQQLSARLPRQHAGVVRAAERLDEAWLQTASALRADLLRNDGRFTTGHALLALKDQLTQSASSFTLHLANSTAVRTASLFFESGVQPILCNRGVNGIEGSVSTAVGYALRMWGLSILVVGDLSFFYDLTALFNVRLPRNLRILLLNNGHGAIFDHLPGLSVSPALADYISAGSHKYTAEGIAQTFGLGYWRAENMADMQHSLPRWLAEADAAQLLEVITTETTKSE